MTSFVLYSSTGDFIAALSASATVYLESALTPGTLYSRYLAAVNESGQPYQNELFQRLIIWAFDVGDFDALADIEAQYAVAERKASRYAQLEGAVPQKDIEAARFELDALRKRRAAIGASLGSPEALLAPVTGTLVASSVVPKTRISTTCWVMSWSTTSRRFSASARRSACVRADGRSGMQERKPEPSGAGSGDRCRDYT